MKTTILPLLACLLLVTGCSYQDFDKPLLFNPVRALFATRRSPTYFDTVDRAELARMREGVLIWQKQSISDEREYAVGVGDELEISVSVPTQIESIATVKQRVAANGEISCPFIGQVQAIGHSITELQRRLVGLYGDGYVKNPIITVSVTKYNSKRYLVTGAVRKPGIYNLETNRISLVEALLNAGGIQEDASQFALVTRKRRSGDEIVTATVKVDTNALLRHSDLTQNVWVLPGDVVHVPPEAEARTYYVFGFANGQGPFPMPRDGTIRLLDALAHAHGISPLARPDKAFLIRTGPRGEKKRYEIDLSDIVMGRAENFLLMSGDILVVRTSWWRRYLEGISYIMGFKGAAM